MKRVLLLLPSAGYRNDDFLAAAEAIGAEVIAAANYCHQLAPGWGLRPLMALPFDQPERAAAIALRELEARPDAVLAVDDTGVELAAALASRLELRGNPPGAVRRMRDKLEFRRLLRGRRLRCPPFVHLAAEADAGGIALPPYPVVVKARRLTASKGVIRADDATQLRAAVERVRRIQARADRDAAALGLVIERFIPGREVALEGLLVDGTLRTLALFDKPDPLDGPVFEETIYVTPSRLPQARQRDVARAVERACRAAGLVTGPIHAEARINDEGVWLLEVAARSIGGLCGRVLRHALGGLRLEELILRDALGERLPAFEVTGSTGVMMIPIPRRGLLRAVSGLAEARTMPGITEIAITARPGELLVPPPDGASYPGFIFARGNDPASAERALREAHARLGFDIQPEYGAAPASVGAA